MKTVGGNLRINSRDSLAELVLGLLPPQPVHVAVDAAGLLEGRDAAAHPGGAAGQLVVRREDGPVERVREGHEPPHGAYGLAFQEGGWDRRGIFALRLVVLIIIVAAVADDVTVGPVTCRCCVVAVYAPGGAVPRLWRLLVCPGCGQFRYFVLVHVACVLVR